MKMIQQPIYKLIPRLENIDGCEYIFKCNKDGHLVNGIPLKNLYFMIQYRHQFIKLENVDLSNQHLYNGLFIFEQLGDILPQDDTEASIYKKEAVNYARKNDLFAQTCILTSVFVDTEQQLEWIPEATSPLLPYQKISPDVRRELDLPYPFDEHENSCLLLEGNIINFQSESGTYIFGQVIDDKIIIRHYNVSDSKDSTFIRLYVELTSDGKYFCRFYFDESENMMFGRQTICGYANLIELHNRIYDFDHKKYIKFLIDNGYGYDNKRFQDSRIKERELYKFGGPTQNMDDEDGGDFIKLGMSDSQFEKFRDMYGGF